MTGCKYLRSRLNNYYYGGPDADTSSSPVTVTIQTAGGRMYIYSRPKPNAGPPPRVELVRRSGNIYQIQDIVGNGPATSTMIHRMQQNGGIGAINANIVSNHDANSLTWTLTDAPSCNPAPVADRSRSRADCSVCYGECAWTRPRCPPQRSCPQQRSCPPAPECPPCAAAPKCKLPDWVIPVVVVLGLLAFGGAIAAWQNRKGTAETK